MFSVSSHAALLLDLEARLYELPLPSTTAGTAAAKSVPGAPLRATAGQASGSGTPTLPGRVEPGSFIFSFLAQVKLTPEGHELISGKLSDAVALLVAGTHSCSCPRPLRFPVPSPDSPTLNTRVSACGDCMLGWGRGAEGERTRQHRRSALQHLVEGLESLFGDDKAANPTELDLYYRVRLRNRMRVGAARGG